MFCLQVVLPQILACSPQFGVTLQPLKFQRFPNIVQVGRTRRPFIGLLWPKQASLVWQHAMCILRLVVAAATLEERWSLQLRATILALEADLPALE